MKKVLFTANLESFFMKFLIPQLKYFKEKGYEVTIATKLEGLDIPYCDKKINIDFARSLNLKQNLKSYRQMKKVFKKEFYDIISCHTPFGAAITRLAYIFGKFSGSKIVYTAHGFHFYKGAPLMSWLLFYPVEKFLARFTDDLITINLEDYELAKKSFKTNVHYVHGIGLNADKFNFKLLTQEKNKLRKSLGLKKDDFVMIYPAELSKNKNQEKLIYLLEDFFKENPKVHLLLPGYDTLNGKIEKIIKYKKLDNQVHILGFRNDIPKLLKISNLSISASKREGLPVNIMEAMYVGLPIIAFNARGVKDLIIDGTNGFLIGINDITKLIEKINIIIEKKECFKKGENKKYIKPFLLDNVMKEIIKIYKQYD